MTRVNGKWLVVNGIVTICLIVGLACNAVETRAGESTGSSVLGTDASPSSSIRGKLEALKAEIASKAAQIKQQVDKKIDNKAWIGLVKSKTDTEVVQYYLDVNRVIIVNEYTTYSTKAKGAGSLKDILAADFIVALGDVDDKNRLTARKILKQASPSANTVENVWGQIQSVNGSTIKLKSRDNIIVKINVSDKTHLTLGGDDASLGDARAEKFLVAVGQKTAEGAMNARFVYYIQSAGFMKPDRKLASPSASVTASPSLRPTKN